MDFVHNIFGTKTYQTYNMELVVGIFTIMDISTIIYCSNNNRSINRKINNKKIQTIQ